MLWNCALEREGASHAFPVGGDARARLNRPQRSGVFSCCGGLGMTIFE